MVIANCPPEDCCCSCGNRKVIECRWLWLKWCGRTEERRVELWPKSTSQHINFLKSMGQHMERRVSIIECREFELGLSWRRNQRFYRGIKRDPLSQSLLDIPFCGQKLSQFPVSVYVHHCTLIHHSGQHTYIETINSYVFFLHLSCAGGCWNSWNICTFYWKN